MADQQLKLHFVGIADSYALQYYVGFELPLVIRVRQEVLYFKSEDLDILDLWYLTICRTSIRSIIPLLRVTL
jgi:hypothetical protein